MNCRINLSFCAFVLVLFLAAVPLHAQVTCYVDDDALNDPGPGDPLVSDPLEDGSVDHPYDAIQEAIDAGCEEIIVLDGTYTGVGNCDIDFYGAPVTLVSENGEDTCIIDCQGSAVEPHRAFYFHSGEGHDTVVEGFTLRNCYADGSGGAIYCGAASSPSIRFCQIIENVAILHGGGIFCTSFSDPDISNCTIGDVGKGNTAGSYGGGIACLDHSSPTISSCTIEENTATSEGGGICCVNYSLPSISNNDIKGNVVSAGSGGGIYCSDWSSPAIENNRILSNDVSVDGGGIECFHHSNPLITLNLIKDNTSGDDGGGICCGDSSAPTITSSIIESNTTGDVGGGIACSYSSAFIANCLIIRNHANDDGGGLGGYAAHPVIINSTFFENSAASAGGGIYIYLSSDSIAVTDCILWDDTPQEISGGGTKMVTYSDVEMLTGVYPGEGNINLNPLFVGGECSEFYLSQVACDDWYDSPCVDTGSTDAASICVEINGNDVCMNEMTTASCHVPDEGTVDMGYHCPEGLPCPFTQELTCTPSVGTLPFTTQMIVTMASQSDFYRTLAGRIDLLLANGNFYSFWRAGYTNVAPHETFTSGWNQPMPALGALVGENVFNFIVMDVTPYPYNQPPTYPASGCVDSDMCMVEGISP